MGMGPKAAITEEVYRNGIHHMVRSKWDWQGNLLGWNLYMHGCLVDFLGDTEARLAGVSAAMDYLLDHSEALDPFDDDFYMTNFGKTKAQADAGCVITFPDTIR